MKSYAFTLSLLLLLLSEITTLTTALPLPQSQPGAAPIDIATPLQQDFALLYKIPTHSTLLLSYPDNGPEE